MSRQRRLRDGRLGRATRRPAGKVRMMADGSGRLHQGARPRARPRPRAAWACAASASRCWSTTASSRRSTSRPRASSRCPTRRRC
ncbi:MAG: hypothetical protein MZW92_50515 [Comamonadaceae bacterium]|nr:hypothetical protein [Comamonadaceae bacterium]